MIRWDMSKLKTRNTSQRVYCANIWVLATFLNKASETKTTILNITILLRHLFACFISQLPSDVICIQAMIALLN